MTAYKKEWGIAMMNNIINANMDENIMEIVLANKENTELAERITNLYYKTDINFNAYYALFVGLLANDKDINDLTIDDEEIRQIVQDVLEEHDDNYTKNDVEYLTEVMTDYRMALNKVYTDYEAKYWDEQAKERAKEREEYNNWSRYYCC